MRKATLMGKRFLFAPILILTFMFLREGIKAQNMENVSAAIKSGNAKEVAKYFDNSIEITILNTERDYSKTQGEMVLKDFFAHNTPTSFNLIHKGSSKQGSQYGIGTLITNTGKFRTYVYIKQKGSLFYIEEIRFEKD